MHAKSFWSWGLDPEDNYAWEGKEDSQQSTGAPGRMGWLSTDTETEKEAQI